MKSSSIERFSLVEVGVCEVAHMDYGQFLLLHDSVSELDFEIDDEQKKWGALRLFLSPSLGVPFLRPPVLPPVHGQYRPVGLVG